MTRTECFGLSNLRLTLLAFVFLCALPAIGAADPGMPPVSETEDRPQPQRTILIERLEVTGNSRTPESLALRAAGIKVGDPATPDLILASAERLRRSHLFGDVEVHTRPGTGPGLVDVIFAVRENRPRLRFGVGHEDFSGWYLIPVQLNMDNLSGRGEITNLSARFGYRVGGLVLSVKRPLSTSSDAYWEFRILGEGQDRIYFLDRTEIRHHIERGGVDFRIGHKLPASVNLEGSIGWEKVEADSNAEVYQDNGPDERHRGDIVPWDDLPAEIRDDVRRREQTRLGLGLTFDRRTGRGLMTHGIRGRIGGEVVVSRDGDFGSAHADLRGYLPLPSGLQIAARLHAGIVSERAPFYERFYLGGLYTVRGYPSQSLSPPHGHLNIATAGIELRSAWVGEAYDPRLVGIAFLDLGVGGNRSNLEADEGAAGIGYGMRLQLPWIDFLGLDVGLPLSATPVDESFHVNLSLGLTY